jgi:putative transposase
MRKTPLVTSEHYHVFNRGVDKRNIFGDREDLSRFMQSIKEFNCIDPIGSIFEHSFTKTVAQQDKLVEIICYCLNPNHFHLLIRQLSDNGISEFMKRLSGGYTLYFNNKRKRSGVLFQGKFKSSHIDSDAYLLHVSAYINLNNRLKGQPTFLSKSSWEEYLAMNNESLCNKDIVLEQFKNPKEYQRFAESSLKDIIKRKELARELEF